jgi:hypothetical protein
MGVDAGTPPGLLDRIRQIAADEVRKFARSGFLRNASITDGGLTIRGGFFRLLSKATGGVQQFYLGPTGDLLGDGERQQVWMVRRADGSLVLDLWDAFPDADGTTNQALSWRDRTGNTVFADDTDSGAGLARPYLPIPFYRARSQDWPQSTSTSWATMYRAVVPKQQPRAFFAVYAVATANTTGEIRVTVNDTQVGDAYPVPSNAVNEFLFGPLAAAGSHMQTLRIEVQTRVTAGTGGVQCCPSQGEGRQS